MKLNITYPTPPKQSLVLNRLHSLTRWFLLALVIATAIANIFVGKQAWSLLVIWPIYAIWRTIVDRDVIEYNRISQSSKLLIYVCVLLILINFVFSFNWASFVIPIVYFSMLITISVFFFTNITKQKQNIMPFIWLLLISLLSFISSIIGWPKLNWPIIVMGCTAFVISIACIFILKNDLFREFHKKFHIK